MRVTALASVACGLLWSLAYADGVEAGPQTRRGPERLDLPVHALRMGALGERRCRRARSQLLGQTRRRSRCSKTRGSPG